MRFGASPAVASTSGRFRQDSERVLADSRRVTRSPTRRPRLLLRGEVHALEEGLEAGVGAEGVDGKH